MHIVFVSRMPPATCGIAEYTSMLTTYLTRLSGVDILVLGGDVDIVSIGERYRDPYSGVEVYNCFKNSDLTHLLDCLGKITLGEILHLQHELGIFPDVSALSSFMNHARSRGIKVATTLHTVIHVLGGEGLLGVQKLLVDSSDVVIVHSVLQEQELLRQGFPVEKIYRIPHGTLINPYIETPRSQLFNELPLPGEWENSKIVTVVGFIRSRDKDYIPVVEAVDRLSRKYDVKLVVAGMPRRKNEEDIVLEAKIERLAREKGVMRFIEGFLERNVLLKLLAVSDVVVIPIIEKRKYPISISGVFHLAIGSRKPVICTRTHKLVECNLLAPELTLHNLTVNELIEKLSKVFENNERVVKAVDRLWKYAQETKWEVIAEKHLELYNQLTT